MASSVDISKMIKDATSRALALSPTPRKSGSGGFFDKVKTFFGNIGSTIKNGVSWVGNKLSSIVSTAHDDIKGLVSGVGSIVEKTEDNLSGVYKTVVHEAGSLGTNLGKDLSSMGMPLAIAAVGVAIMFVMMKK